MVLFCLKFPWLLYWQVSLFESIRPLFANKQLIIVANKVDVIRFEQLSPENRKRIDDMVKVAGKYPAGRKR